jgi:hypothetical protein
MNMHADGKPTFGHADYCNRWNGVSLCSCGLGDIDYTPVELGKLTGAILHELGAFSRFHDDPITIQSSCGDELVPLVWRFTSERILVLIFDAGMTPRQFLEEVEDRTSPKWIYFSGLSQIRDIEEESEHR